MCGPGWAPPTLISRQEIADLCKVYKFTYAMCKTEAGELCSNSIVLRGHSLQLQKKTFAHRSLERFFTNICYFMHGIACLGRLCLQLHSLNLRHKWAPSVKTRSIIRPSYQLTKLSISINRRHIWHWSGRCMRNCNLNHIWGKIFDHENSRSRSWPRPNLMVTFEA